MNTILGWCGITSNSNKNTIVAELLISPEGLGHLNDETEEGMIATFRDFGRRDANDGKKYIQPSPTEAHHLPHGMGKGKSEAR